VDKHDQAVQALYATSIYRAMYYLNYVLLTAYQLHLIVPEHTWLHLNKLYYHAEKLNLVELVVNKTSNEPHSISALYKNAVLLAASNPYQLGASDIQKLYNALVAWGSHAKIQQEVENTSLVLHLNEDSPPTYHIIKQHLAASPFIRGLKTDALCHHVTAIMKQRDPHSKEARSMLTTPVLQKIITAWSNFSSRHITRASHQGAVKVAIGLSAIYHQISCGKAFVPTSKLTTPAENTMTDDAAELWLTQNTVTESITTETPLGVQYPVHTFQIVNSSMIGYCLQAKITEMAGIETGELLGVQNTSADAPWRIGTVRWIKKIAADRCQMGILILGHNANIVAVDVIRTDSAQRYRALLVSDRLNIDHPGTLILPVIANLVPHEQFTMLMDDQTLSLQLTQTVLSTDRFMQVAYVALI
jgi:hypothetical protein